MWTATNCGCQPFPWLAPACFLLVCIETYYLPVAVDGSQTMDSWDEDILYLAAIPVLLFILAVLGIAMERFLRKRRRAKRRAYHSRSRHSQRPQPSTKPVVTVRTAAKRRPTQPGQPLTLEPMPTVPGGLGS